MMDDELRRRVERDLRYAKRMFYFDAVLCGFYILMAAWSGFSVFVMKDEYWGGLLLYPLFSALFWWFAKRQWGLVVRFDDVLRYDERHEEIFLEGDDREVHL